MAKNDQNRMGIITVDLSRIAAEEFDPKRPLRVAAVRGDQIIEQQIITPAEQKDPRHFEVALPLGDDEDGVAGAQIVVAPADDERNLFSPFAARRFVAGSSERINGGTLTVSPSIYTWWRFCWFPRKYRVSGRVVRHDGDCTHPVGAANVEIYDVDYCWWWYDEDLIISTTTDADGFFDVTFTWCVPLWCLFRPHRPPIYIDPDLRDRLYKLVAVRFPIPPIPPGDPWQFERLLHENGVMLPRAPHINETELPLMKMRSVPSLGEGHLHAFAETTLQTEAMARTGLTSRAELSTVRSVINWHDLFGGIIFWPPCDDPCDWRPDVRIRVTQNQPNAGTVEIFRESFWDIHWNLNTDLLNLTLEANDKAIYADACRPDPLLGNCMLFERVGNFNVSTIYQPDEVLGVSYGATPDRRQRLGYTVSKDRAWCLTPGVHGDFGLAAHVDYYQVQFARWTPSDLTAWDSDHTYVPPEPSFAPVSPSALGGFTRLYAELQSGGMFWYYLWKSETFAPQTIGGISGLYKSRQRFEQEYRDAHGGSNPAPDYVSGWYWDTTAMTRLFNLDSTQFSDGLYTFRLIGYTQTGVDGGGQPILTPVNMGLPGGVVKQCSGGGAPTKPALLTLFLSNAGYVDPLTLTYVPRKPKVEIKSFKKNGVTTINECEILVLDTTDTVTMEFEASDAAGNLEGYGVSMQHGYSAPAAVIGAAGVSVTGTMPDGPDYLNALADVPPATAPYWYGGDWVVTVPASFFTGLGGSCGYVLTVSANNRLTDGWSAGAGWGEVSNSRQRAFTVILTADKETYCEQLGCCPE